MMISGQGGNWEKLTLVTEYEQFSATEVLETEHGST